MTNKALTEAIKSTGVSVKEFCETRLGMPYINYFWRVTHGSLRLEDYHKIFLYTGKKFDDLFPNPLIGESTAALPPPLTPTLEKKSLETKGEAEPKKKFEEPARKEELEIPPSKPFVFIDPFAEVGVPVSEED